MSRTGARYTLHAGDVVCGQRGDHLETLLGSCVAIILTDPLQTVGVMCHIVHTGQVGSARSASGAYGARALDMMFDLLRARAIDPLQCVAYVYGGGNMFPSHITGGHVGQRNADWVLDELAHHGIRVVLRDLCGCAYRRLSWTVGAGAPTVVTVQV